MAFVCRRLTVVAIAIWFAMLAAALPARAGGVNFGEDSDSNDGPSYFGFVRDDGGSPVSGARVTAALKAGGALVTRTDIMGLYKFPGLRQGRSIPPTSTSPAPRTASSRAMCVRRPHGRRRQYAPVEVECYLQKQLNDAGRSSSLPYSSPPSRARSRSARRH